MDTISAGNAGLVGAYAGTVAAVGAGSIAYHQLRMGAQAFRIVTPAAAQRAAFEKDGLPGTWTVENGEFFVVKYDSCQTVSPAFPE